MDAPSPIVPEQTGAWGSAAGAGAFDGVRRQRFSSIAHADHLFMSPLAEEKVDHVLARMRLAPGERVVDIGCGNGEMLIRLVEASVPFASSEAGGALGVGIDRSEPAIEMARRRAAERRSPIARTHIEWRVGDASGLVSEDSAVDRAFDAALCVGATGAFGGFQPALGVLRRIARPGGRVVVGEGFWRTPPHADYLAALGATADEMTSHAGNVEAAIASGFTPLYSVTSSDDEWDHYEGLYLHAMERWLAEHPGDPDHAAFTARIHAWRDAYLRWGRSTLGFGVYVLRCPDQG